MRRIAFRNWIEALEGSYHRRSRRSRRGRRKCHSHETDSKFKSKSILVLESPDGVKARDKHHMMSGVLSFFLECEETLIVRPLVRVFLRCFLLTDRHFHTT